MRFSDQAVRVMLDALDEAQAEGITHLSLHTAYSASGANEVSGGSPAYARKAATWSAASGRSKALSSSVVFDVPAGTTVRWVGGWDASTAGDFKGMTPNGGGTPEAFTVPDAATDVLEAPGHGFSNGQTVVVWAVPGVSLPTGLAEGTVYYVRDATTDDLKLAATSGGAAIDLTSVGSGYLQRIVEETFGAQGTHTISAMTLTID
jgi:hypothetical protein